MRSPEISIDGSRDNRATDQVIPLLSLALVIGAFFILRYGGRWAESDTAVMTGAIRVVMDNAALAPPASGVYVNGYGYQVISMAIVAFTGLSIETLQVMVYPLVSAFLVLPAWTLYRELTGSARIASLATLLLWIVPEHLFAVLRGSHERLDRAFLFTALWLLVRTVRFGGDRQKLVVHVALVLLMIHALIATNALFGMSFVAALATALFLSVLALRGPTSVRPYATVTTRLLGWASVAGVLLIAVFVQFMYPPLGPSLAALVEIPGKLVALIVSGAPGFDPYSYVETAWVSTAAFVLLSITNFVVLGASVVVWLSLGRSWIRGNSPENLGTWLLWLLFAAFAIQGAAAIVSDRTGSLQGNVQYRAFSVFAAVAVPMVAVGIGRWRPRTLPRSVAVVAFGFGMVCALAKTTLEPAVSNKWMFYTAAELQGLRWADAHQRNTDTWVGPDDRLPAAYLLLVGDPAPDNAWITIPGSTADIDSFLVSDPILQQSARLDIKLPSLGSADVVYENADARLLHSPSGGATDP